MIYESCRSISSMRQSYGWISKKWIFNQIWTVDRSLNLPQNLSIFVPLWSFISCSLEGCSWYGRLSVFKFGRRERMALSFLLYFLFIRHPQALKPKEKMDFFYLAAVVQMSEARAWDRSDFFLSPRIRSGVYERVWGWPCWRLTSGAVLEFFFIIS